MIPCPGTPAARVLNAITSRQAAVVAVHRLQEALHAHGVYTAIAYDDERPRLQATNDLTVWADPDGLMFFWVIGSATSGARRTDRAERGPVAELDGVARRIAGQLAVPPETGTVAP
ncbi:hypothetical protein [Streptosporangium sp. NPDC087985]|uniref:hypothetical protein n=1 Tax=Streptosporangium sp. NPDC087985 TaxID=3366196 RepID=UPI00382A2173